MLPAISKHLRLLDETRARRLAAVIAHAARGMRLPQLVSSEKATKPNRKNKPPI